jgi:hypothetical protein
MASTFALSRPSEKLGTHSTNVFGKDERINQQGTIDVLRSGHSDRPKEAEESAVALTRMTRAC